MKQVLRHIDSLYFIGIGGIGMSALARYAKQLGLRVAGYDRVQTALTQALEAEGIAIDYDIRPEQLEEGFNQADKCWAIYTPAVPVSNAYFAHFEKQGVRLMKRAELLGKLTEHTQCLAVAGTHGKTTTSAILAHLLNVHKQDFVAFLGGVSEDFQSNFLMKGHTYSVVEADEFDRSFLHLSPSHACVTHMDADHLDIYGDPKAMEESYKAFAEKLRPGGQLIVRQGLPLEGLSYGFEQGADYQLLNLEIVDGGYRFDFHTPKKEFKGVRYYKPGRHNVLNAAAAWALADQICPAMDFSEALAGFKGVERRFSYVVRESDFVFIDDYAHHPTEIDAVYEAVSKWYPAKKTLVVFQPHLFSRTQDFETEFAESLSRFEAVFLMEIYPAREEPIPGVTSSALLEKVKTPTKALVAREALIDEIKNYQPELLLMLGAGDIGKEVRTVKNALGYEA
ncbi:UDP-N-acetylmuramate--L-alanine ligase [Aureicoccus marinus]|uniref:UDP-N-acetylmuramate--L-alanine ligase n=1 Tax=Aureicoccus marinus TaxID=754435 RepID=A0A2S7T704_9FLAO|nr:cyanophycin synthetase [Aureicoccus marinus]PQJ15690.1 UDP-N-acetylmuramate--L-alanine ligase [Aureicoccus marinus]